MLYRAGFLQLQSASLLFVDSPVGTGYSYVDNEDSLTTDITQATDDLVTFLKVLLKDNPEFQVSSEIKDYLFQKLLK